MHQAILEFSVILIISPRLAQGAHACVRTLPVPLKRRTHRLNNPRR